jgi:hypothetical protein
LRLLAAKTSGFPSALIGAIGGQKIRSESLYRLPGFAAKHPGWNFPFAI